MAGNYEKGMYNQLMEVMARLNTIESDLRTEKIEHKNDVEHLNAKINDLTQENHLLREDNARLKNMHNHDSSNTSLPPSTDQKGGKPANTYNGREKTKRKAGGQKGHKGTTLTKAEAEEKICSGNCRHVIKEIGTPSSKGCLTKYVIDLEVAPIVTEIRIYADEEGKFNVPSEYRSDVTYGPAGSNALLVSGDGTLCAIFNIVPMGERTDVLYLTKAAEISCQESDVKNYNLYCLERKESELFYRIYEGKAKCSMEYLSVYPISLLDFEIKIPVSLSVPIAIDFGTANTTAGVFLDYRYFEQTGRSYDNPETQNNTICYAVFYDTMSDWEETTLFPSVVGVHSLNNGKPKFLFGHEAIRLANSSYIDEGFCVFYDIKRWVSDYEKVEEVTDREGHRQNIERKDILKAYFLYILSTIANQFKCKIEKVHISCPV